MTIGNNFIICGVCISNFLKAVGQYENYNLLVETEGSNGEPEEHILLFYGSTRRVNFNENMLGKTVCCEGRIDTKKYYNEKSQKDNYFNTLVCEKMLIFDDLKEKINVAETKKESKEDKYSSINFDKGAIDTNTDLPF